MSVGSTAGYLDRMAEGWGRWSKSRGGFREALEASWSEPEAFAAALPYHLERRGLPLLESPGARRQDVYGSLVTRHLARRGVALIHPARPTGWTEVGYADLHATTARLAVLWLREGVRPGAQITLVLPPGPSLLVGLLTALRLGLTPSVLLPLGRGFVSRRLAIRPPEFIAHRPEDANLVGATAIPLPVTSATSVLTERSGPSATYPSEAPVLEVFSPFSMDLQPVTLTAGQLLFRLGVDAALTLRPRPGDRIAAPLCDPLQHQPLLPLMVLFAGATYVEAPLSRLVAEPLEIHLVGVNSEVRDRVARGEISPLGWRRWFKSPAEPFAWEAWRSFGENLARRGILGQNLLLAPGFGGALLFSPPTAEPHLEVLPAPGLSWMLAEPGAFRQETAARAGVLAPRAPTDDVLGTFGAFLIGDAGDNFLFSGSFLAGRAGTTYPAREVSAVVSRGHPAVDGAAAIIQPDASTLNGARVTMVLFTHPLQDPSSVLDALARTVRRVIEQDMGSAFLPDRVLAFPIAPRWAGPFEVDLEWCRFQLLTGALEARSRNEIFRLTSLLRRWAGSQGLGGA